MNSHLPYKVPRVYLASAYLCSLVLQCILSCSVWPRFTGHPQFLFQVYCASECLILLESLYTCLSLFLDRAFPLSFLPSKLLLFQILGVTSSGKLSQTFLARSILSYYSSEPHTLSPLHHSWINVSLLLE